MSFNIQCSIGPARQTNLISPLVHMNIKEYLKLRHRNIGSLYLDYGKVITEYEAFLSPLEAHVAGQGTS